MKNSKSSESRMRYHSIFEARLTECLMYHRMDSNLIRQILLSLGTKEENKFFRRLRVLLRERKAHFIKGKISGEEFLDLFKDPSFEITHQRIANLKSWHYICGPLRRNQRGPGKRCFTCFASENLKRQKRIDPIINKYF